MNMAIFIHDNFKLNNIYLLRTQCCCSNDLDSNYYRISDSFCNTPCVGDPNSNCGGQYVTLVNVFGSNPNGI